MAPIKFKPTFTIIISTIIAVVSNSANTASAEDVGRITNGVDAVPHEFPFMVAVQANIGVRGRYNHICGGALVTKRHVITAAHCFDAQYSYSLVLGAHGNTGRGNLQRIGVLKWHVHPGYAIKNGKSPIKNDIAVITLKEDAKFSQDVAVIPLPKTDIDESGKSCTGIGWGRTSQTGPTAKLLQKTDLIIKTSSECSLHFRPNTLHPGFSCAYGYPSGVCEGDSGGPLACKDSGVGTSAVPYFLFGVTSAGQIPCGGAGKFEIFSRVGYAEHLSFVTNIISQEVTGGGGGLGEVSKLASGINVLQSVGTLIWLCRNQ